MIHEVLPPERCPFSVDESDISTTHRGLYLVDRGNIGAWTLGRLSDEKRISAALSVRDDLHLQEFSVHMIFRAGESGWDDSMNFTEL